MENCGELANYSTEGGGGVEQWTPSLDVYNEAVAVEERGGGRKKGRVSRENFRGKLGCANSRHA